MSRGENPITGNSVPDPKSMGPSLEHWLEGAAPTPFEQEALRHPRFSVLFRLLADPAVMIHLAHVGFVVLGPKFDQ